MTSSAVYNFVLWLFHRLCEVFTEEIKQCSHGCEQCSGINTELSETSIVSAEKHPEGFGAATLDMLLDMNSSLHTLPPCWLYCCRKCRNGESRVAQMKKEKLCSWV